MLPALQRRHQACSSVAAVMVGVLEDWACKGVLPCMSAPLRKNTCLAGPFPFRQKGFTTSRSKPDLHRPYLVLHETFFFVLSWCCQDA